MSTDIRNLRMEVQDLKREIGDLQVEVRGTLILFNRTASLVRRLSGDENIDRAIGKMQKAIAVAQTLRMTMIALQAASGPLGWAMAAIGLAATTVTVTDFAMDLGA